MDKIPNRAEELAKEVRELLETFTATECARILAAREVLWKDRKDHQIKKLTSDLREAIKLLRLANSEMCNRGRVEYGAEIKAFLSKSAQQSGLKCPSCGEKLKNESELAGKDKRRCVLCYC